LLQPKFRRGAARKEKAVKEQLANMTIIELVRTGHSFATSIQHSETHSAIVREMASRLEALNIAYIRAMNIIRSAADDRSQQQTGITFFSADELSTALGRVQGLHEISVELIAEDMFKQHVASPATDAWMPEQLTQAHKEGAYFVANRMLAAWEAGFIEDTAKNAADIARMILTSTEFMADAPEGDFDRSFADGVLEGIAAQQRNGEAL